MQASGGSARGCWSSGARRASDLRARGAVHHARSLQHAGVHRSNGRARPRAGRSQRRRARWTHAMAPAASGSDGPAGDARVSRTSASTPETGWSGGPRAAAGADRASGSIPPPNHRPSATERRETGARRSGSSHRAARGAGGKQIGPGPGDAFGPRHGEPRGTGWRRLGAHLTEASRVATAAPTSASLSGSTAEEPPSEYAPAPRRTGRAGQGAWISDCAWRPQGVGSRRSTTVTSGTAAAGRGGDGEGAHRHGPGDGDGGHQAAT